jgi:hypothetical protein
LHAHAGHHNLAGGCVCKLKDARNQLLLDFLKDAALSSFTHHRRDFFLGDQGQRCKLWYAPLST